MKPNGEGSAYPKHPSKAAVGVGVREAARPRIPGGLALAAGWGQSHFQGEGCRADPSRLGGQSCFSPLDPFGQCNFKYALDLNRMMCVLHLAQIPKKHTGPLQRNDKKAMDILCRRNSEVLFHAKLFSMCAFPRDWFGSHISSHKIIATSPLNMPQTCPAIGGLPHEARWNQFSPTKLWVQWHENRLDSTMPAFWCSHPFLRKGNCAIYLSLVYPRNFLMR